MKINKLLKYCILALLVSLAILSIIYKYDNCSKCSLDYEGKELNGREFMFTYARECLREVDLEDLLSNFSINP